ncbi:MAG: hypothetical protein JXR91_02500 [Deltaproteobacteria bacterium]|nr:hypothetical protein [Deltaproteobacteria bacterium]
MRLAFINHAIPVRSFEVKVEGGDWIKGSRSGGAYEIKGGPTPSEGAGMIFRVKSAEGEIVTSTNTVPFLPDNGSIHDLGVQFTPKYKSDQSCEFVPPADVYNDSWGGIDKVVWRPNPWKDHIKINEKTSGCYEKSSSCLEVLIMAKWEGAHFYYGQPFPFDTFGKLSVAVKSVSGKGTITIMPNGPHGECTETEITVDDTWQEITIDLAAVCTNVDLLNTVTVKNYSEDFDFILDKIQFE